MQVKDWLFIIGVAIILLGALSSLYDKKDAFSTSRRKSTSGIHAGYTFAVFDLLCATRFLEWRRGLVHLGLPDGLSWVLAPIGLIVVIAASMVSWETAYGEGTRSRWWVWLGALAFYIAGGGAYIAVAASQ